MRTFVDNQDPLLSRRDAAKYLGLTEKTLAVWASTGRQILPMIKIGGRVKYRKSALDKFIAEREV
ncbi:MAG TPA: helix-turn-helix domain-containing protein [Methylobacter sp.]|jgi:excisionase family DNA binding protein